MLPANTPPGSARQPSNTARHADKVANRGTATLAEILPAPDETTSRWLLARLRKSSKEAPHAA